MAGYIIAGMLYGTIITLALQFGFKGIRKIRRNRRAKLVNMITAQVTQTMHAENMRAMNAPLSPRRHAKV